MLQKELLIIPKNPLASWGGGVHSWDGPLHSSQSSGPLRSPEVRPNVELVPDRRRCIGCRSHRSNRAPIHIRQSRKSSRPVAPDPSSGPAWNRPAMRPGRNMSESAAAARLPSPVRRSARHQRMRGTGLRLLLRCVSRQCLGVAGSARTWRNRGLYDSSVRDAVRECRRRGPSVHVRSHWRRWVHLQSAAGQQSCGPLSASDPWRSAAPRTLLASFAPLVLSNPLSLPCLEQLSTSSLQEYRRPPCQT